MLKSEKQADETTAREQVEDEEPAEELAAPPQSKEEVLEHVKGAGNFIDEKRLYSIFPN